MLLRQNLVPDFTKHSKINNINQILPFYLPQQSLYDFDY
jgi:hypothetical protein